MDIADGKVALDPLGATVLQLLADGNDFDAIVQSVADSTDLPMREVEDHVGVFLDLLEADGIIPSSDPSAPRLPGTLGAYPYGVTLDFIMKPHPMAADPTGRPSSLDVLRALHATDDHLSTAWERIVDTLRGAVGPDQTVWGVKLEGDRLSYELYFCHRDDPPGDDLINMFDRVAPAFASIADWTAPTVVPISTGMVSFEFVIDEDGRIVGPRTIETYQPSDNNDAVWVNYRLGEGPARLRNTYQAHDLPADSTGLARWFRCSRFATLSHPSGGAQFWLDRIAELRECAGTWCARKPTSDGMYLRRIHPADLASFLTDHGYPEHLRRFVTNHLADLDHLRFEISFDFTVDADDVRIGKTGFYGYF